MKRFSVAGFDVALSSSRSRSSKRSTCAWCCGLSFAFVLACGGANSSKPVAPDGGVVSTDMGAANTRADVGPDVSDPDGSPSVDTGTSDLVDQGETDADGSPTGEMVAFRNLAYDPPPGVVSDLATLDVFRADDGQVRPLVLLVHGGSWIGGDKAGFEQKIVPWWIEEGYVAAPVNFRLATRRGESPEVKPADQVRDIAAALSWLLADADSYQIDTRNIVILGYSSGAHLVALLGTDERFLRDVGLDEEQVAAVISFDVHAYDVPYALELMVGSVVEQNRPSILHLFGRTEAEQLEGSPISYLDGWAAPAFVVSVDADPEVEGTHGYIVSKAAARYVAALAEAGHSADTFHDSNETHSSLVGDFGEEGDRVTEAVKTFLDSL